MAGVGEGPGTGQEQKGRSNMEETTFSGEIVLGHLHSVWCMVRVNIILLTFSKRDCRFTNFSGITSVSSNVQ